MKDGECLRWGVRCRYVVSRCVIRCGLRGDLLAHRLLVALGPLLPTSTNPSLTFEDPIQSSNYRLNEEGGRTSNPLMRGERVHHPNDQLPRVLTFHIEAFVIYNHVTWLLGSAPIRDRHSNLSPTIRFLSIDLYFSTRHL
jgi:hypothetical protein